MDAVTLFPHSKSQKLVEGRNLCDGEDKLSNLPDSIIHHILSFLPTTDAVRTSLLSSKWINMWTHATNINLECPILTSRSRAKKACFLDFVERVLLFCDTSCLEMFRLVFWAPVRASRVNSWITFAIKRRIVQKLVISVPWVKQLVLPRSIFSCESLTRLELTADSLLKIPSFFSLPRLKYLHLNKIMFVDSQSTQRFFTSLPVLEDLTLEDCKWNNLHDISMCFQTLKSLGIICDTLDEDEPIECMIKVHALNLRSLKCSYNLGFELLHDMQLLVDASIELRDNVFDNDIDFEPAMKLINRIQLVKSLAISDSTFDCLARVDNFEAVLPLFSKLTHLEVTSEVYFYNRHVVEAILHKSPNLEFLTLGQGTTPQRLVYEEDWWFKPAPICIKSKLKRFSISHYSSSDAENYLITQLLKDGSVLEKITIVCGKFSYPTPEQVEQLRNEFQMMPRASLNCVIQIS